MDIIDIIIFILLVFGVLSEAFKSSSDESEEDVNKSLRLKRKHPQNIPLNLINFRNFIDEAIHIMQSQNEYVFETEAFQQPIKFIFQTEQNTHKLTILPNNSQYQIGNYLLCYYANNPDIYSAFKETALAHISSEYFKMVFEADNKLKIFLTRALIHFDTKDKSILIRDHFYNTMLSLLKKLLNQEFDLSQIDQTIFKVASLKLRVTHLESLLKQESINQSLMALNSMKYVNLRILELFREYFKSSNIESLFDKIITIRSKRITFGLLKFMLDKLFTPTNYQKIIDFLNQFNYLDILYEFIELQLQSNENTADDLLLEIVHEKTIPLPPHLVESVMEYFLSGLNRKPGLDVFIFRIKLVDINLEDKHINSIILNGITKLGNVDAIPKLKKLLEMPKSIDSELKDMIKSSIKKIKNQIPPEKLGALSVVGPNKQGILSLSSDKKGSLSVTKDNV